AVSRFAKPLRLSTVRTATRRRSVAGGNRQPAIDPRVPFRSTCGRWRGLDSLLRPPLLDDNRAGGLCLALQSAAAHRDLLSYWPSPLANRGRRRDPDSVQWRAPFLGRDHVRSESGLRSSDPARSGQLVLGPQTLEGQSAESSETTGQSSKSGK